MEWQHNIPDDRRFGSHPSFAVYEVGKAIIERLDYIAEALDRRSSTDDQQST